MTAASRPTPRLAAAVVATAALLAGCVSADVVQRQPEAPDDGLQATGRIGGGRMAISDGGPTVTLGDCDPRGEADQDLCIVARSINGEQVNLVIENPAVLEAGTTVPIEPDPCVGAACDAVRGHAVVELRVGRRDLPVTGGRLEVTAADERYAAAFELRLSGEGRLTGRFNVRPQDRPVAPAPAPSPSPSPTGP